MKFRYKIELIICSQKEGRKQQQQRMPRKRSQWLQQKCLWIYCLILPSFCLSMALLRMLMISTDTPLSDLQWSPTAKPFLDEENSFRWRFPELAGALGRRCTVTTESQSPGRTYIPRIYRNFSNRHAYWKPWRWNWSERKRGPSLSIPTSLSWTNRPSSIALIFRRLRHPFPVAFGAPYFVKETPASGWPEKNRNSSLSGNRGNSTSLSDLRDTTRSSADFKITIHTKIRINIWNWDWKSEFGLFA